MEQKVCKVCRKSLPIDDFYKPTVCICKRCVCKRNHDKVVERNVREEPPLPGEEWRKIIGVPDGYLVSNFGRVRGLSGRLLRPNRHRQGYLWVAIAGHHYLVHRLVAIAFLPNPEHKETVNHKNLKKDDNSVNNLEWATQKENNRHARDNGAFQMTETMKEAITRGFRLSRDQVREIRRKYASGERQCKLADEYGVSRAQICRTVNYKSRKTV